MHRHEVTGILRYGKMLITVDVDGHIRLTKEDGSLTGRMHLLNPLPEFWSSNKDKKLEIKEMEFVLEILEHLRSKNPKISQLFNIS